MSPRARDVIANISDTSMGHNIESLELLTDGANGLLFEEVVAYRSFPAPKIFRDELTAGTGRTADLWSPAEHVATKQR